MSPLTSRRRGAAALAIGVALSLSACSGDQKMADSSTTSMTSSMSHSSSSAASTTSAKTMTDSMAKGAYLSLADHEKQMADRAGSTVVYFFHASWCPDCKATDAALVADGVPDGLTVVKVDYDTATGLKKKYGVTTQHTFVAVDPEGMATKKWTGSANGAAIKAMVDSA